MRTLGCLVALLALVCGCPRRHVYEDVPGGAPEATAVLEFDADVPDALVYVNEVFQGRVRDLVRERGLAVTHGTLRVELRHQRYHTHYSLVRIAKGKTVVVRARLRILLE